MREEWRLPAQCCAAASHGFLAKHDPVHHREVHGLRTVPSLVVSCMKSSGKGQDQVSGMLDGFEHIHGLWQLEGRHHHRQAFQNIRFHGSRRNARRHAFFKIVCTGRRYAIPTHHTTALWAPRQCILPHFRVAVVQVVDRIHKMIFHVPTKRGKQTSKVQPRAGHPRNINSCLLQYIPSLLDQRTQRPFAIRRLTAASDVTSSNSC